MLVKLFVGIGDFGKLWTGTRMRPAYEDPKYKLWDCKENEVIANIVDALIIERTCECGASTRKFRATAVQQSEEAREALHVPVCFITAGGVGSIAVESNSEGGGNPTSNDLLVWNWSGRYGGHVILSPVMVYVSRDGLPEVKPGYHWAITYSGSTHSEYVLLRDDQSGHALPIVKLSGECPPCREKREAVSLATDGQYTLTYFDGTYKAGCRNFRSKEAALAHWSGDGERAKLFAEAITNFVEPSPWLAQC